MLRKRIAVFVSGGGTDFQSIIDAIDEKRLNAEIVLCVCNNPNAYALERAEKSGIPAAVFSPELYGGDKDAMFAELADVLDKTGIDYIVLAGYLLILPAAFVHRFKGKIINIHPALLPKYGGKGFYGMNVHRAVIAAYEKKSGATVHFVDEGIDTGEIIMQTEVPVDENETPESLQKKVLEAEHDLLPNALIALCGEPEKE